jgi:hypothetical protein
LGQSSGSLSVLEGHVLGGVVEAVLERAAPGVPVAEHLFVASPAEQQFQPAAPLNTRVDGSQGLIVGVPLAPAAVREVVPRVLLGPSR